MDKKELDKALADYSEAIKLEPRYSQAFSNRGLVFLEKKDYDKAIADFTESIRLEPHEASSFSNRAAAYTAKARADEEEARKLLKK
jgi:tetratricopeptide (TPR) repeat protein